MPAPLALLGRLLATSAVRAEGAELAAGGLGRATAGSIGKNLLKKKLLKEAMPDNDDAPDDKAVAKPSPSFGQVTSVPQFGASAPMPTSANDNSPMASANTSMFDSTQAITLLTTSVMLLRNIVEGIEHQAAAARDAARAMRESQLENGNAKNDINTSEAQDGATGPGIGTGLAALGIGAAGIWGLKQLDQMATKSADQLTEYFSDHLSKFLGSFIEDLPKTMMKFMIGAVGGNPTKAIVQGAADAIRAPGVAPDDKPVTAAKGDRARHMKVLYDTYRKQGLTHEGSVTMLAQIGREGGYNPNNLFGRHKDPHRGDNIGMMSWQGSRNKEFITFMKQRGHLDEKGNVRKTDEALAAQAEFSVHELRTKKQYAPSLKALTDPNKKYGEIEGTVGDNYIAWRRNDPKYRSSGYRNQNFFLKQAREVVGQNQQAAQKRAAQPQNTIATPVDAMKKSLDVMTKGPTKPVARSSFVDETPAFGSMFGQLGVNPAEQAEQTVRKTADGNGLLDRVLGTGGFNGARIQAPKLGQLDNVMMSVLRDIVESASRPAQEAPVNQSINMPVIAQGGQQQAAPAMSLTVPSPGKALSSMSWDMYFDTNRGL